MKYCCIPNKVSAEDKAADVALPAVFFFELDGGASFFFELDGGASSMLFRELFLADRDLLVEVGTSKSLSSPSKPSLSVGSL